MRLSDIDVREWDDIPAEWLELQSTAAFLAFFKRQYGLKNLKAVLAMAVESGRFHHGFLERAAKDLDKVRLHQLATIVRHYAEHCPVKPFWRP